MIGLKAKFVTAYMFGLLVAFVHSVVVFANNTGSESAFAWIGVAIATWPHMLFFGKMMFFPKARTSANLSPLVTLGVLGAVASLVAMFQLGAVVIMPLIYSVVIGMLGNVLFVFWYSRFDRTRNEALQVGTPLPAFELQDIQGNRVTTKDFVGTPTLFVFFPGNWCPLCMAQIKEIATQYPSIAARGAQIALISPQRLHRSMKLAGKFDLPLKFFVDNGNRAARKLAIDIVDGTPSGVSLIGYDKETVMPTVLITDAAATIIYADLTENYRLRPEPAIFIDILDKNSKDGSPAPVQST